MADRSGRGTGVLAVAAVIAGLTSMALIATGFWLRGWVLTADDPRLGDPRWWLGLLSQVGGWLVLGKGGFKVALAVVLGASGLAVWLRERRRLRRQESSRASEPGSEEPGGEEPGGEEPG